MKQYDHKGNLLSEINTCRTSDGKSIVTTTTYNSITGRPIFQHISTRDSEGRVTDTDILNGKLLP